MFEIGGIPFLSVIQFIGEHNFDNIQVVKCQQPQDFTYNLLQNFNPSQRSLKCLLEAQREVQQLDRHQFSKFEEKDFITIKAFMMMLGYNIGDNIGALPYKVSYLLSLTYIDYPLSYNIYDDLQTQQSKIESRSLIINRLNKDEATMQLQSLFQNQLYTSKFQVIQKITPILIEIAQFLKIIPITKPKIRKPLTDLLFANSVKKRLIQPQDI